MSTVSGKLRLAVAVTVGYRRKDGTPVVEQHLTIDDLAKREGVPVATIYQWNSRGDGPRYMKIGRHVRYRLADVVAWENARVKDRASA